MATSHEYITNGALMRCNKGAAPAPLLVPPTRTVWMGSQRAANASDKDPMRNNFNFGVCTLTQKPCLVTCRPLLWRDVKDDVELGGAKALLDSSSIRCAVGGTITFDTTGQTA
jgi:hypothetical protein